MTADEYQAPQRESASRAVQQRFDRQLETLQQRSRQAAASRNGRRQG
jgi:hypothetical protein